MGDKQMDEDRSHKKKDKKREEEKRLERHHSQGFKIPKMSSQSSSGSTESQDKDLVGQTKVTPSPVGRSGGKSGYNAQGRYTQEIHRAEKFYQRQKFEKRINIDRVEQGEAGNPNLGDIMNSVNKLVKDKAKELSEDEQETDQ